jgi:glycosyltransferase involved in cell wall biosynthesis
MKNLKIDVVVKYFYPVAAGIETNVMETYSVLAKKGAKVTIHTSKDTLLEKNILKRKETIRGLNILRKPFQKFGYWPNINFQNTDVVALHNFDIFPHFWILLYCLFLKVTGRKNFALFLTPHGGFNPEWSIFSKLKSIIKQAYHFTVGTLLINLVVDGMRAVSDWERMEIIKKGVFEDKVVTIDNGIEDEAYKDVEKLASTDIKDKVKSFGKYIVQIGRIYPIKNYETTIKALVKTPSNLHYVIAGPIGDQAYSDKLNKLAKELGVEKRVHFVGVIRGIDKYYLIKKSQMMVHMAIWESYCNVVHEGLSQGLVCIVANNTALPFLIKNRVNGYCVETKNVKILAQKINHILKNKNSQFIKDIEKRNREYGLENSWRKVAIKMGNFYQTTLDRIRKPKVNYIFKLSKI